MLKKNIYSVLSLSLIILLSGCMASGPTKEQELAWEESRLRQEQRLKEYRWESERKRIAEKQKKKDENIAHVLKTHKTVLKAGYKGIYKYEEGDEGFHTQFSIIKELINGKTNVKKARKTVVYAIDSDFKVMSAHKEYVLFRSPHNDAIIKLYMVGEDAITPVENQSMNLFARGSSYFVFAGMDSYTTVTGASQQVYTFFNINKNTLKAIDAYIGEG